MSKGLKCGKHKMLNSNLKKMGSAPSSSSVVFAVLFLVLNVPVLCHGGKTSSFVRKVEKTVDMPLDSDVFRVPPGYNAPQQVYYFFVCFLFLSFLVLFKSELWYCIVYWLNKSLHFLFHINTLGGVCQLTKKSFHFFNTKLKFKSLIPFYFLESWGLSLDFCWFSW